MALEAASACGLGASSSEAPAPLTPPKKRRLRAASTAKQLWQHTRWTEDFVLGREEVQEMIRDAQSLQLSLISGALREALVDVLKKDDLFGFVSEWSSALEKLNNEVQYMSSRVASLERSDYEQAFVTFRNSLAKGVPVHIGDLVGRQDLEGKAGLIVERNAARDRWVVDVGGKQMLVKAANVFPRRSREPPEVGAGCFWYCLLQAGAASWLARTCGRECLELGAPSLVQGGAGGRIAGSSHRKGHRDARGLGLCFHRHGRPRLAVQRASG